MRHQEALFDVRDREDCRENYMDGYITKEIEQPPSGSGTGEGLKCIGVGWCWCGEDYGHDWTGKSEGAPHPKVKSK